jgi:hypothetical protein
MRLQSGVIIFFKSLYGLRSGQVPVFFKKKKGLRGIIASALRQCKANLYFIRG